MAPGGYQGGYTGWWVGRAIPGTTQRPREDPPDSEAGPGQPCRGWEWVVRRVRPRERPRAVPRPTLRARSLRSLVWGPLLENAASWPIRARLLLFSHKLSQNGIVSPEYVEKACLSPYFQNEPQSQLLIFSDFHFGQPSLPRN